MNKDEMVIDYKERIEKIEKAVLDQGIILEQLMKETVRSIELLSSSIETVMENLEKK